MGDFISKITQKHEENDFVIVFCPCWSWARERKQIGCLNYLKTIL